MTVASGNWEPEYQYVIFVRSLLIVPSDRPVDSLMTELEPAWMTIVPVGPAVGLVLGSAIETSVWFVPDAAAYVAEASRVIVMVSVLLTAPDALEAFMVRSFTVSGFWPSMVKLPPPIDDLMAPSMKGFICVSIASISDCDAVPSLFPMESAVWRRLLASSCVASETNVMWRLR